MSPLPFVGLNGSRVRGPVWRAYTSVPPALGVAAQAALVFTVAGTTDEGDPDAPVEELDPLDEHAEPASATTATSATADHFILLLTLSSFARPASPEFRENARW